MNLDLLQVEKARARSQGLDLRGLAEYAKDKAPQDLSPPQQLRDRRNFLRECLQDEEESQISFERIIAGSEIQDVNYLARGARAAKAVARIAIRDTAGRLTGYGTGFLIAPQVLITNNHVLPTKEACSRSQSQFDYELDIDGKALSLVPFDLLANELYYTSKQLDFTVVAVAPRSADGAAALERYGHLPFIGVTGKISDGEWLTIIQHPNGDRKQVCVRENKLIRRTDDVLWYSTDTLGGSSGSPALSNDWFVVALHHSGVPDERDGRIQTIYGRDYDPSRDKEQDIRWVANEGIRVSRIVETLRSERPGEALLAPIFRATPSTAKLILQKEGPGETASPDRAQAPINTGGRMDESNASRSKSINVTLNIDAQGVVTVLGSAPVPTEALDAYEAAKASAKKAPAFDVPFNSAYDDRAGYDETFLDPNKPALAVHLPQMSAALGAVAAPLLEPEGPNENVLNYHGYSLVMHAKRRFALFSAANVDFSGRYELSRPADVWRQDPRIAADAQLTNFYYASNQFDRGHLTRREDMEYGRTRRAALISAADTCHWTNCTPQHARFNQNKELWQGIERHIFEDAIELDHFRAQVITGPILEESDPVWKKYPKIQYPVRFWKVVAAVTSGGELFATAYVLDQSAVIDEYGIEAAREIPFDAYKTFQVPIVDVEELTQLRFLCGPADDSTRLASFDPLAKRPAKPRNSIGRTESTDVLSPSGWLRLTSLDSVVLTS